MLRGCQKQLVMLKTGESRVFESAWFVLRDERGSASYDDMIAEANRIVAGGVLSRRPRRRRLRFAVGFLLGAVTGGGLATLIFFLL